MSSETSIYHFIKRCDQGYYNGDPMHGAENFQRDQANKDIQRENDLRRALRADGIRDVERAIQWAHERARAHEQAADAGTGPRPMVRGYALTLTFLLRLVRGMEVME